MSKTEFIDEDLTTLENVESFIKKSLAQTREIPSNKTLQIQQIVNVSVPKQDGQQNYDAERNVLKLTLTDGSANIFALLTEPLFDINMNTPPGTKIESTQSIPINGQSIVLTKYNHRVLGGKVGHMIEKWNFNRKMDIKKEWGSTGCLEGSEGPPMWRPFGQKSASLDVASLRTMKAMDIVNEKKEGAGKDEGAQSSFDVQRNEAISELMDKSVKQKWQKPNKKLLDKEILDIMDEGFTVEEATEALGRFKNTHKAIRFLKGRKGDLPFEEKTFEERKERKKRNTKNQDEDDDAPIPKEYQRPNRSISLFGFIAEHIKSDDTSDNTDASLTERKINDLSDSIRDVGFRDRGRGSRGRGYQRGSSRGYGGDYRPATGRASYNRTDTEQEERFSSHGDRSASFRGKPFNDSGVSSRGYNNGPATRGSKDYNAPSQIYNETGQPNRGYKDANMSSGGYGGSQSSRGFNDSAAPIRGYGDSRPPTRGGYRNSSEATNTYSESGSSNRGYGESRPSTREVNDSYQSHGRQDFRASGYQDAVPRNIAYVDFEGANRKFQEDGRRSLHQRGSSYSSRNTSTTPSDSQSYYQPPRFQKQQRSSAETSVPFNDTRNPQESNYLPPIRPVTSGNYQQRGSGSESYNNRQQFHENGYRTEVNQQDQRQYGNSEGWNLNHTMVFTRSKPDSGGGRGSGRGRGGSGFDSRGGGGRHSNSSRY